MNTINQKRAYPSRGEVYLCNLGDNSGHVQDGKRPVLVLSANEMCRFSPVVTVAPITSNFKRDDLVGHVVLPECEALDKTSMLLLEQITTVQTSDLETFCGMIKGNDTWNEINRVTKRVLGLSHKVKKKGVLKTKDQYITCLCRKCVSFYKDSPEYRVKRITPPEGAKDTCDRCGSYFGYDYLITEKEEG